MNRPLAIAAALLQCSQAVAACTSADIVLDKLKSRADGDYIYITGRLLNNCATETGVQIKVTVYNTAGDILAVKDSWPASINNIPARSDFPFQTMIERQRGFAKYEARVIATKVWQRR